jgi:hypothetical protein
MIDLVEILFARECDRLTLCPQVSDGFDFRDEA